MRKILLVAVSCWLAVAAGCASDTDDGGAGGSGAGGSGAGGSGSGGAGGSGSGGDGGTGAGGSGGVGSGGSGGTGSGGSGGSSAFTSFADCTFATAVPATSVVTAGFAYDPPCVKLTAGATLSIFSSGMHPLRGMALNGDQPNPIAEAATAQGTGAAVSVTFPATGSFGFHCQNHGQDAATAAGMAGVVYVEP